MKCSGSGSLVKLEDGRTCPVCGKADVVILTCIVEEGCVQEHDRVMKRKKGRRKSCPPGRMIPTTPPRA